MENVFCVVQTPDSPGCIQVVIIYFMISLIFLLSHFQINIGEQDMMTVLAVFNENLFAAPDFRSGNYYY